MVFFVMSVPPMILVLCCLCAVSPGVTADTSDDSSNLPSSYVTQDKTSLKEDLETLKEEMRTLQKQQLNWGVLSLARQQECQMPVWWKEFQTMKEELNALKLENNAISKKLEVLSEAERSLKRDLASKSKQLDVINSNFTDFKLGFDSANVAFEVVANAHVTTQPGDIYKFDTVVLNNGGGYHAPTGIFEAPVSGTYLFWGNVHHTTSWNHITVVKEGVTQAVAANDRTENNLVYLAEVNKGERVWFSRYVGGYTGHIFGSKHSSYGGCLVHAY